MDNSSPAFEVGYNVPALVGMREDQIQTPCLIIELDAFERNIQKMRQYCASMGVRHRIHGKMHKSVDIARYQIEHGDACGICCQKVSEALAFARAGIADILVSNQVCQPQKIAMLMEVAKLTRTIVCVDDSDNIAALSRQAVEQQVTLEVLVEIDCGAGRCGVVSGEPVLQLAQQITQSAGLIFAGIQAYQGAAQHQADFNARKAQIDIAIDQVTDSVGLLKAHGIKCDIIGGGGTGTYYFEGNSGVFNELQSGSYAFMDADYQTVLDDKGNFIDEFENSLFILTSIMSHTKTDKAICDAGLKVQSVDSGMPVIFNRQDVKYIKCSDEHGVIADPQGQLKINDTLKLIPGHCDPTCNIHDYYVGVRNGTVAAIWPITARGKAF